MSGRHSVSVSLFDEPSRLLVVTVVGTLEHGNADGFLRDARASVDEYWQAGLEMVKLDVEAVSYIDSSGIGALVELYKYLTSRSARMSLVNIRPGVRKVMELLGLEKFLHVE
ncbi:MAG TPA: STAS domain-containing protein [Spirochaetia bacterium]|nr:STAS domain-containing protein [Spirochaetia bacterium]